jgi:uncharacterized Zn finger protein (UPF0148 family)
MSDFDKEAEREKLREKYEQEADKREATEQMSELLLKGATMTNAHCGDCGDPIFRYDGQEFCPTCEKAVDRETDAGDEAGEDTATDQDQSTGTSGIEVTAPDEGARVKFGGEDDTQADASTQSDSDASAAVDSPGRESQPGPMSPNETREHGQSDPVSQAGSGGPSPGPENAKLGRAQQQLTALIDAYTQRAAAADSPQAAREYLATAREAAQTLDATRP